MKITFFNMLFEMGTLGLLNVITYLEKNGYPSKHVYLVHKCEYALRVKDPEETDEEVNSILSFIEQEKPDLIGFSLMTYNFFRTKRLTEEIKQRFPDIPILWGGIHPTFDPDESIRYADYICVGEGEDATLEFIQALESGSPDRDILNIWRKQDGRVVRNDVRPLIQNLDDYPVPEINWDRTYCLDEGLIKQLTHELYQKYVSYQGKMYDIMISRGCPYSCSYCCNALFKEIYRKKGKYLRYRSADNAIEELKSAIKKFPYPNMVNIQDDGFAAAPEDYLKEFSEKYKRHIGLPLRLRIIPTLMNETKMKYLKDANTLVGVMGLQANDRINREIFNRHAPSEQFIKVARLMRKYNIVGSYDLITQNPYTTEQDMVEICEILSSLPKPYRLDTLNLALFPNTPLRKKAIKDGIKVNESDGYTTMFGSYPEKFPQLLAIQEVCPYTPKFLIAFFLRTRNSRWGRMIVKIYRSLVFGTIQRLRDVILRNTNLVRWTKRIIFLPDVIFAHLRSWMKGHRIFARLLKNP